MHQPPTRKDQAYEDKDKDKDKDKDQPVKHLDYISNMQKAVTTSKGRPGGHRLR